MKKIYILFLSVLFFISCVANTPKIYQVGASSLIDITLMPFVSETDDLGYINLETLEIVIPAQYDYAEHFTGDFAVVSKEDINTLLIINRDNKIVLSNIDQAFIFSSENGKIVFALTANYSGRVRYNLGHNTGAFFFSIPRIVYGPSSTNYKLYNLNTGKLVLNLAPRGFSVNNEYRPKIMVFSNYLACDNDLYEINPDGTLTKSTINTESAISQTVEKRGLIKKEKDFHYNLELFFDPYFWYFDNLDLNLLFEVIPDNMGIWMESERGDFRFKDKKIVLNINPINRNMVYPLKENNLLYGVQLLTSKKNDRYAGPYLNGSEKYIGLYDTANNNWAIPPTLGQEFYSSGYDDWVNLKRYNGSYDDTGDYYNIRERKIYRGLYGRQRYANIMTYYGYSKRGYEISIKNF